MCGRLLAVENDPEARFQEASMKIAAAILSIGVLVLASAYMIAATIADAAADNALPEVIPQLGFFAIVGLASLLFWAREMRKRRYGKAVLAGLAPIGFYIALFSVLYLLATRELESNRPPADLAADTASLPATDIYLAPTNVTDEDVEIGAFRTAAATPGYDNQPSFLPGEAAFYFVSEGAGGKTDIWRYDIQSGEETLFFVSPSVSEFSPKAAPGDYGVSYIQENEAGDVTRVHHAPAAGGPGEAVVDFAPLGYYAWLEGGARLAVYLRSEPAELHLIDIATGDTNIVAQGIGRAMHAAPDGGGLYFTQASGDENFRVMFLDLANSSISPIIDLPAGAEDFAPLFAANGALLALFAGDGARLTFARAGDAGWMPASDLSASGVTHVTRIAVSDDGAWIAVVTDAD